MTVYAIADTVPKSTPYLTAGKKYEVVDDGGERIFEIVADNGKRAVCVWENCGHLEGGKWRRVEGAE